MPFLKSGVYLVKKAFAEKVEEERKSVIEFHLLVAERHDEEDGSQAVLVLDDARHGEDHQTQGDSVVLEMPVIYQDQS